MIARVCTIRYVCLSVCVFGCMCDALVCVRMLCWDHPAYAYTLFLLFSSFSIPQAVLQDLLASPSIGQPLSWSPPPPPPSPAPPGPPAPESGSFVCRAQRCFQFDGMKLSPSERVYTNATCCSAVASTSTSASAGAGTGGARHHLDVQLADQIGSVGCPPLQAAEWLLLKQHWRINGN